MTSSNEALPKQTLEASEKPKAPRHSEGHSSSEMPQPHLPGAVLSGSAGQPSSQSLTPSPSESVRAALISNHEGRVPEHLSYCNP